MKSVVIIGTALLLSLLFIPSLVDAKIKCPSGSFASGTICLDNTKRTPVTPISTSDEILVTDIQIGYIIIGVIVFIIIIAVISKASQSKSEPKSEYDYRNAKRQGWTPAEQLEVRNRQNGKCYDCEEPPNNWEYHHKDGNRGNNNLSNCVGLCPNCHAKRERS